MTSPLLSSGRPPAARTQDPAVPAPGRRRLGLDAGKRRAGLKFVAPALVLLIILDVAPILTELFYSFTKFSLLKPAHLVGFAEYEALFSDPVFWHSVLRTFYFAGVLVVVGIAVSLGVAVLLTQTIIGTTFHRIVIFLPQTVSYAAGALIWVWLFNPTSGPINTLISSLGGPSIGWLSSPGIAMPSLLIVSLWRDTGYYMLVFLAALANVPTELYEAAHLDGAGPIRTFREVVLPSIRPAMLFVLLTWTLGALQMFTQAYVMTNGGPGNATLSVVLDIYKEGFQDLSLGYASAESFVVFLFCLVLSLVYVRWFRTRID